MLWLLVSSCTCTLLDQGVGCFSWSSSDLRGSHVMVQLHFIVLSHHACGASCGARALVCFVSFPFTLSFEVHGGSSTVQITFYKCWIVVFQVKSFQQTERINGFPVSSKFRSVATQAMSLCGFFPSLLKIKPYLGRRLTFCDL